MDTEFKLSERDMQRLSTCDPRLIQLVQEASKYLPLMVLEGFRGEAAQFEAYRSGRSKESWPNSKHNRTPSLAVDISPLPYDSRNTQKLIYFSGIVMGISKSLGLPIRSGCDWNRCLDPGKNLFPDMFHFEVDEASHLPPVRLE